MQKYFGTIDVVDGVIILGGLTISLQDLQSTLSIILIVIDILWLIGKFTIKFIRYCKDGELSQEEIDDLLSDSKEIKKSIDNAKNKEGEK